MKFYIKKVYIESILIVYHFFPMKQLFKNLTMNVCLEKIKFGNLFITFYNLPMKSGPSVTHEESYIYPFLPFVTVDSEKLQERSGKPPVSVVI